MKKERNIISINEYGKVILPTDMKATAMSEWELCELFNVTAPTIKAGIKALCKSGVLNEYEMRHTIRLSDKCSMEVYSLETIIALAFRIGTYSAKQVRNAVLERVYLRKEKTTVFVSLLTESKTNGCWQS
ncbi:hypothetical protein [Parabacteroides sp.]